MNAMSVPASKRWVAKLCRRPCMPTSLLIFAFFKASAKTFCALRVLYWSPYLEVKLDGVDAAVQGVLREFQGIQAI